MNIYIIFKLHTWKNFGSWDMGQKVLNQPDLRIFWSTIYPEQITNYWSKIFWVGMVWNGCDQSGYRTLKLTISQEGIDGINWFFARWCKFRKTKSYFTDFWVGMVKNGFGYLVHETQKSAERVYELSWIDALLHDSKTDEDIWRMKW